MTEIIVYTTETCPKCRDREADALSPWLLNITCAQPSIRNVCSAHIEMIYAIS